MAMAKTYQEFEEVEEDVIAKSPATIFKYRDWGNSFHQKTLTGPEVWLAHPKTLNDPYDIRTPVRFDYSEVEHPLFYEKLKSVAKIRHPEIPPNTRDFRVMCENQMEIIRANPAQYFESNAKEIREANTWDIIGVLSLSITELNETMWAHYGNSGRGFCVGLDTVMVCKALQCGFGYVEYSPEPALHSFIAKPKDNLVDRMFLKHPKWKNEEEYRFLTARINSDKDRSVLLPLASIKEVTLGQDIREEHKNEIISVLRGKYNSTVALYQCESKADAYEYSKRLLDY